MRAKNKVALAVELSIYVNNNDTYQSAYHAARSVPLNEPRSEKTGLRDFRPGPTQIGLYSYRRWLEA